VSGGVSGLFTDFRVVPVEVERAWRCWWLEKTRIKVSQPYARDERNEPLTVDETPYKNLKSQKINSP